MKNKTLLLAAFSFLLACLQRASSKEGPEVTAIFRTVSADHKRQRGELHVHLVSSKQKGKSKRLCQTVPMGPGQTAAEREALGSCYGAKVPNMFSVKLSAMMGRIRVEAVYVVLGDKSVRICAQDGGDIKIAPGQYATVKCSKTKGHHGTTAKGNEIRAIVRTIPIDQGNDELTIRTKLLDSKEKTMCTPQPLTAKQNVLEREGLGTCQGYEVPKKFSLRLMSYMGISLVEAVYVVLGDKSARVCAPENDLKIRPGVAKTIQCSPK